MAAITQICNPAAYPIEEAIRIARSCAASMPGFDVQLAQSLQSQCLSVHVSLPHVFRGLEILGELVGCGPKDVNRLMTLVRPFLKSSDPQIASKAVLILGRQSRNLLWLRNVMSETDERIRANLIESLWRRDDPEIGALFRSALRDPHPRVAANAVYGLYLMGDPDWCEALDRLIASDSHGFRRSAAWLIRKIGSSENSARLQRLIRDNHPDVRRAAFGVLKHLRDAAIPQLA